MSSYGLTPGQLGEDSGRIVALAQIRLSQRNYCADREKKVVVFPHPASREGLDK